MTIVTATLDANAAGTKSLVLTLAAGETVVSMYAFSKTGLTAKVRIDLEISPDNVNWIPRNSIRKIPNVITEAEAVMTHARANITVAQGSASTVTIVLISK